MPLQRRNAERKRRVRGKDRIQKADRCLLAADRSPLDRSPLDRLPLIARR